MGSTQDKSQPSPRELAELSALADGTIDPARRAQAQERIAASPELQALYERERQVVERLHAARASDRAPQRLRTRIEAQRTSARSLARRRAGYGGALAGALAVLALALVLALPSGTPAAPSVAQAAGLALRGVAQPAPSPDPSNPSNKLGRDVEDVYFPNWQGQFGWRAVGQRMDRIGGRQAVTVYYQWHNDRTRIAYTIVSLPALSQPSARQTLLNGTELRTFTMGGRVIVTWRRLSHTCVLSGPGVPSALMRELAAWKAPGVSG
jgi:hypothetical protein